MKRWSPLLGLLLVVVLVAPVSAQLGATEGLDGSVVLQGPDDAPLVFRATLSMAQSASVVFSADNLRTTTEWDTLEENVLGDTAYYWGTEYVDENENSLGLDIVTTIHLWESEDFAIVRYTLTNTLETDLTLYASTEVVPTLEGANEYGGETADVNSAEGIAYIYEGERFLGVSFLNRSLVSYRAPDYDEFETAPDPVQYRYDQMSSIENSELPFTSDYGLLPMMNSGRVTIAAGNSYTLVTVWGYGVDATSMTTAVLAGEEAYTADIPTIEPVTLPSQLSLEPAWPNPFNAGTMIRYHVNRTIEGSLTVVDLLGRHVATLASGTLKAGDHTAHWQPSGISSGTYFVVLQSEAGRSMQRVTLLQ